MSLKDRRARLLEEKERKADADANPDQAWEYHARNMAKTFGPTMEGDFNKLGEKGWELVQIAEGYAIFKRPKADEPQHQGADPTRAARPRFLSRASGSRRASSGSSTIA
jgi:hypothetical protein